LTRYTVFENDNKLNAVLGSIDILKVNKIYGEGYVWTTFSRSPNKDGTEATRQVDLNFANPDLLLESIKIVLFYISKSSDLIRLDAVAYIWKVLGSASLHEKEVHVILEIIDKIINYIAPHVLTIAEVNEPQDMVLTYLGSENKKESDMVYQFAHFPLVVHAIHTENAEYYKKWIKTLSKFNGKQFITILGSHDGMGLKPVRGILPQIEIDNLTDILISEYKALPNLASLPGGGSIVYEICATPWNLLNKFNSKEMVKLQIQKYILTIALGLTIKGLPAFYINGVLASDNYRPENGLDENRTVNREQFDFANLISKLSNKKTVNRIVFDKIIYLLKVRSENQAFNPNNADLEILECKNNKLIVIKVSAVDDKDSIFGVFNISENLQKGIVNNMSGSVTFIDLVSDMKVNYEFELEGYGFYWLKRSKK